MSVLLGVLRNADEALSEFLVQQVTTFTIKTSSIMSFGCLRALNLLDI